MTELTESKEISKASKKIEIRSAWQTFDGIDHLPRQLNSLNKIYLSLNYENDRESLHSLFHMYVFVLCSFCETLLRTTFKSVLKRNWNELQDIQHMNLIEQAEIRLQSISWENLKKEVKVYLNSELPSYLKESEYYGAINIMFHLRNLLIHGNEFERSYIQDSENNSRIEITGQAQNIYKYLIEKNLIANDEIANLEHYELNPKTISFFIKNVIEFTKQYSTFLMQFLEFNYYEHFEKKGIFDEKLFKALANNQ